MNSLAVLCAGTDYDADSGDLVAQLGHHLPSTGVQTLFVAGPGSLARTRAMVRGALEEAVAVAPLAVVQPAVPLAMMARSASAIALDRYVAGSLEPAVDKVTKAIRAQRPGKVVIAGWSRGAIAAILIAKQLHPIKTSLLLFDPVPGALNLGLRKETRELSPNVDRCDAVLMLDEQGLLAALFAPQGEPFHAGRRGLSLYMLPGEHGSAIRDFNIDPRFHDSAHIGKHLAFRFLEAERMVAPAAWRLSDTDLVAAYGRLAHRALYGQTGVARRPGLSLRNERRAALFFVNQHHAEVFRKPFPAIASVIDPMPMCEPGVGALRAEARRLKVAAPAMAQVVGEAITLLTLMGLLGSERERLVRTELLAALDFRGGARPTDACFSPRTGY